MYMCLMLPDVTVHEIYKYNDCIDSGIVLLGTEVGIKNIHKGLPQLESH